MSSTSPKVRVGIIGAGGIANVHARYYKEIQNVEMVGVAEVIKERGEEFAKRWGIPQSNVFTNYEEMIDRLQPDAVSVTTPHKYHAAASIYALKRGVNVLVEKPMASSVAEALEMYRTSMSAGKILMVGFQTRFEPQFVAAKRIVESGTLGDFYYGESLADGKRRRSVPPSPTFYTKEMAGGGVVLDLGCYAVDTAMNILGFPEVERVSGHIFTALARSKDSIVEGSWGAWDTERFEVEDFFVAKLVLSGGGVIVIKDSWAMHNNDLGRSFFLGTRGGIKLNPLEVYRDEWGHMTTATVTIPNRDPWRDKVGRFVEAVSKGGKSPIDPREIVYDQLILDSIYSSANRSGEEVRLNLPEEVKGILKRKGS